MGQASSARARVSGTAWLIGGSLAAAGLVVTAVSYAPAQWLEWIPDLGVGLAFTALSVRTLSRAPRLAALAAAVAGAWWLATLLSATLDWEFAVYWHRGPLIHLLFAYRLGTVRTRLGRWTVAAGYAACLWVGVWGQDSLTFVLCAALAVIAVMDERSSRSSDARWRRWGTLTLAVTIAAGPVVRLFVPASSAALALFVIYCAVLVAIAASAIRLFAARDVARVTDLVVELDGEISGDLQLALSRALGDPELLVGYWDADSSRYRTASGFPVVVPAEGSSRHPTFVDRAGAPFAVLVHDTSLTADAVLVDSLRDAALLTATNADLRDRERAAIGEVRASQARLAASEVEERTQIAQRLDRAVAQSLRALVTQWNAPDAAADPSIAQARAQLTRALDALDRAAIGLQTPDLDEGLGPALRALAARSPVPVTAHLDEGARHPSVERALLYVASEALTNVAKHSGASTSMLSLHQEGERTVLVIRDDGRGGADLAAGSGLAGLADRVSALGGSLSLRSPAGAGTELTVEIPSTP